MYKCGRCHRWNILKTNQVNTPCVMHHLFIKRHTWLIELKPASCLLRNFTCMLYLNASLQSPICFIEFFTSLLGFMGWWLYKWRILWVGFILSNWEQKTNRRKERKSREISGKEKKKRKKPRVGKREKERKKRNRKLRSWEWERIWKVELREILWEIELDS